MGSGYSKMKKQARMMQEQFAEMRKEMQNQRIEGVSGNGLVRVTIDGEKELRDIKISPECVDPEDLEGLQDLIISACKNAYEQAETQNPSGNQFPF